jgi:hypothetical protein
MIEIRSYTLNDHPSLAYPFYAVLLSINGIDSYCGVPRPEAETSGIWDNTKVTNYLNARQDELTDQGLRVRLEKDNFLNLKSLVAEYNLSFLNGVTPAQIDAYIDNNITSLATARDFLKKLTKIMLLLARQARLED